MKINKSFTIVLLITFAFGFIIGWYLMPDGENEEWTPDKINLYYIGEQNQITKLEWPQVFDAIQSLIVFEKGNRMSEGNPSLSAEDVKEMKNSGAVEYVYDEPMSMHIYNGEEKIKSTKFKSILFPIDEKWNGAAYIQTTDSTYLFFASRASLDFILRHFRV